MRIAVLANLPVWTLPGLEHLRHGRGYATWLEPLIPALSKVVEEVGVDLHWITLCKETDRDLEHTAFGQTFHILSRGSLALQMLTAYWQESRRIRKVVREIQPDLVHAWGTEEGYGRAGTRCGVNPRLFTMQGCIGACVRKNPNAPALVRLQARYEPATVRSYPAATGESAVALGHLKQIHPGINARMVEMPVAKEFFAAKWNPSPQPNVIFVGAFSEMKGARDLLEVFQRPELSHIDLRMAGRGELASAIEAAHAPNIRLLGHLDRSALVRQLESAWCLVIPTWEDTGPSVVKEARVVGLPVVTTTAAGSATYISDMDCGIVTAPGDKEQLVEGVLKVCESRQHAMELGKRGWQAHREQLHPDTAARNLTNLYRELLGDNGVIG